jgi:hypothetical protein
MKATLNQLYAEFFTLDERMDLERDGINTKGEKVEYRDLVDRVNILSPLIDRKRREIKLQTQGK